jgi:hypothetical protein
MIPALIGSASAILIAIGSGLWLLSGRIARLEQKVEDLPTQLSGHFMRIAKEQCAENRRICFQNMRARDWV